MHPRSRGPERQRRMEEGAYFASRCKGAPLRRKIGAARPLQRLAPMPQSPLHEAVARQPTDCGKIFNALLPKRRASDGHHRFPLWSQKCSRIVAEKLCPQCHRQLLGTVGL